RVVDAARDELLAGPGLAGDEHRQLRRRHLLERGEDLAHGRRAADDAVEAVPLRQRDLDDVLRGLEAQLALPDAELRAWLEEDLAHAQVADEGAVARVEVAQAVAVVLDQHLEVRARDRLVVQDQVVDDAAAARYARLAHLHLAPGVRPGDNDQLGLAQAP